MPIYPLPFKRIPPELVLDSFRKSKLKPIRGEFMDKQRSGCCALGAVAIAKLKPLGITLDRYTIGLRARDQLGLSESYFTGFVSGWDNEQAKSEVGNQEFVRGLSDGKSAFTACCDAGLVEEVI